MGRIVKSMILSGLLGIAATAFLYGFGWVTLASWISFGMLGAAYAAVKNYQEFED